MRLLFPLAMSLTLIGCATTKTYAPNEAQISQYDPANTARVRLITGDTSNGGFLSGQTCEMFYNETVLTKTPEEAGWQTAHVDSAGLYPFRATVIAVRQLSSQGNTTVETPLRPQVCAKTPSGWYTVNAAPLP